MTDYVTHWSNLEFPSTFRPVDEVLERYGLPQTYEENFRVLVALLVGLEETAQKTGSPEFSLFARLGHAFFALGGGDGEVGHKYMSAAHAAARDIYAFDISRLNGEWSGIGLWRA